MGHVLRIAFALAAVCAASTGESQSVKTSARTSALFAEYERGPHLGSPEEAVVGIEVTNRSSDDAVAQTRHGSGFVLRCDGFVLAPTALFGRSVSVAGRTEDASKQIITVTLHPGTPREKRVTAATPRFLPREVGYIVIKMDGVHSAALQTMAPYSLHTGDALQLIGVSWVADGSECRIDQRAAGALAPIPSSGDPADSGDARPGERGLTISSGSARPGSVVLGPGDAAIGIVVAANSAGQCDRFVSFAALGRATNCVTPIPTPPGSEPADLAGMVEVAGGPFVIPPALLKEQPDLAGATVACVAPFKIDKYEVTNREYLAFWLTLPESDRKRLGFQSNNYPASWSKVGDPFPASIQNLPVIGVPMPGALAYARAHGKRLPTPYEWCLAAFGPRGEQDVVWAKRYVSDRNDTWQRVKSMHFEYLQQHPELQQETYYNPSHFALPWLASSPAAQNAARWSKQTVESLLEPLWQTWREPPNLLEAGTRDFDVSPCGARDMILNAAEMVQPYPGGPINGRTRYMEVNWERSEPTEKDPWTPRALAALAKLDALPPLSRLFRRALLSPPPEELISLSNMSETIGMLAPLSGWELSITSDATLTVSGLIPRRPIGSIVIRLPGSDLYQEKPRHYREEMGLAVPMDHTDRSPSGGPQLYYMAPSGFRCVR